MVHMETLENIMSKEGFQLVWRKSFPQLFEESLNNPKDRQLMNTMGVLRDGVQQMRPQQAQVAALFEAVMFTKRVVEPDTSFEITDENLIIDIEGIDKVLELLLG